MWGFLLSQVGLADAVDLFRARRVFIKDGFAYVPLKDIDAIVLSNYRTKLSKALAVSLILIFTTFVASFSDTLGQRPF